MNLNQQQKEYRTNDERGQGNEKRDGTEPALTQLRWSREKLNKDIRLKLPPQIVPRRRRSTNLAGGATAGRHGGSCIATRIFAARYTHHLERRS